MYMGYKFSDINGHRLNNTLGKKFIEIIPEDKLKEIFGDNIIGHNSNNIIPIPVRSKVPLVQNQQKKMNKPNNPIPNNPIPNHNTSKNVFHFNVNQNKNTMKSLIPKNNFYVNKTNKGYKHETVNVDEIFNNLNNASTRDMMNLNENKIISNSFIQMGDIVRDIDKKNSGKFEYAIDIHNIINLKSRVKKIYHVYQEKYAFNKYPSGLGDFIRSCYFIIQFCQKYNFEYEIIINHPISNFLEMWVNKPPSLLSTDFSNKIERFSEVNLIDKELENNTYINGFKTSEIKINDYINYLSGLPVLYNSVYSYNIFFPYDDISSKETQIIQNILKPTDEMVGYVDDLLKKFNMVHKKFIVFHIRSGDKYLNELTSKFDKEYIEIIVREIKNIIEMNKISIGNDLGRKFDIFLIADNFYIKDVLKNKFPILNMTFEEITHLGEGTKLEKEKVKNTMIDFYLMSHASSIYSFTTYLHGSGFSHWCSKLYNIPYYCRYVKILGYF